MNIIDLINKKRLGLILSDKEIKYIIEINKLFILPPNKSTKCII